MWFEDIPLGNKISLGSYTFTEEAIMDFARKYDPQPFHLDRAAAARSPYGGIIASGWHTAAVWMKLMVTYRQKLAVEKGGDLPNSSGVSPGFRELRWFKPVRPGITLTYSTEAFDKLAWPSRPQLGLLESRNEAVDEKGELMMSFIGRVLLLRKPLPHA